MCALPFGICALRDILVSYSQLKLLFLYIETTVLPLHLNQNYFTSNKHFKYLKQFWSAIIVHEPPLGRAGRVRGGVEVPGVGGGGGEEARGARRLWAPHTADQPSCGW